jgi:hypothetical protein
MKKQNVLNILIIAGFYFLVAITAQIDGAFERTCAAMTTAGIFYLRGERRGRENCLSSLEKE